MDRLRFDCMSAPTVLTDFSSNPSVFFFFAPKNFIHEIVFNTLFEQNFFNTMWLLSINFLKYGNVFF